MKRFFIFLAAGILLANINQPRALEVEDDHNIPNEIVVTEKVLEKAIYFTSKNDISLTESEYNLIYDRLGPNAENDILYLTAEDYDFYTAESFISWNSHCKDASVGDFYGRGCNY